MNQFFRELFEYNYHMNQQLVDVIRANPDTISERTIRLFSHVLNAHHIWNSRTEPQNPDFGVWEIHPPEHFHEMDKENYDRSMLVRYI